MPTAIRARGGIVAAATHVGLDWPDAVRLAFNDAETPS